jgi:hypothetical protein
MVGLESVGFRGTSTWNGSLDTEESIVVGLPLEHLWLDHAPTARSIGVQVGISSIQRS